MFELETSQEVKDRGINAVSIWPQCYIFYIYILYSIYVSTDLDLNKFLTFCFYFFFAPL